MALKQPGVPRAYCVPEIAAVALPGVPPWTDQDIVLYHGTVDMHVASILQAVDLRQCQSLCDFGRGFYTTTNQVQAERWANNLAAQQGGAAAVIEFTVERDAFATLDCLFFVRSSPNAFDFWSFVQYCKTIARDHNRRQTPWYDIVAGPVPGDWKKQTVIPDGDQVSFHTHAAVGVLNRLPANRKRQVV
jgi:hypothetical protein